MCQFRLFGPSTSKSQCVQLYVLEVEDNFSIARLSHTNFSTLQGTGSHGRFAKQIIRASDTIRGEDGGKNSFNCFGAIVISSLVKTQ
ncbi:hypothetical protein TorRG33x02_290730 [Trema orientale]|uniref:Uncharacterized protein n=1 Tax=Trema orientale TaxID=63057 RepID=A0A2P5CC29_TREOI|nr:hypothetical protein TorRG33x02_290730 [Trema orientale]